MWSFILFQFLFNFNFQFIILFMQNKLKVVFTVSVAFIVYL